MKYFQTLILLAIMSLTFVACQEEDDDDDDKDPGTQATYYPLAEGSFWVYAVSSEDATSYEKDEVKGSKSVDGKSTSQVDTYEGQSTTVFENEASASNYYYTENGKTYASIAYVEQLLSFSDFGLTFPLNTELKFVKVIDFSADSWDVIEMDYNNLPLSFQGQDYNFTGTIKLTARKLADQSYTNTELNLSGNAKAIEYSFALSGNVTAFTIPLGEITISSKREHWYMENVGLVKRVDTSVSLTGTGTLQAILGSIPNIPGSSYELQSYTVASASAN